MSDTEAIRAMVAELAGKSAGSSVPELTAALDKVSQALKSIHDIDKNEAEIRKLSADEARIRYDLDHAAKKQALETRKEYATIFAPVVTTLVLGLTLILQAYQFMQSERDKREAAEDAQWSDAVKAVSAAGKLSPVSVILNPFLKSKRYADPAKTTAVQFLVNTHERLIFADLFREAFEPVTWANLNTVLQLDRTLGPRLGNLYGKTYDPKTRANDIKGKLSPDEQQEYDYIRGVLKDVGTAIAPLLSGQRPAGQKVDLRSAWFSESNWTGADLSGADLQDADLRGLELKDADLSGVKSFSTLFVYETPWWDAKRIGPDLLDYLLRISPFDPQEKYGPGYIAVTPAHYADALKRLRAAN